MSTTCCVPVSGDRRRRVKMYALTKKGMECVKAAKN